MSFHPFFSSLSHYYKFSLRFFLLCFPQYSSYVSHNRFPILFPFISSSFPSLPLLTVSYLFHHPHINKNCFPCFLSFHIPSTSILTYISSLTKSLTHPQPSICSTYHHSRNISLFSPISYPSFLLLLTRILLNSPYLLSSTVIPSHFLSTLLVSPTLFQRLLIWLSSHYSLLPLLAAPPALEAGLS